MRYSGIFVIILWMFLLGKSSLASGYEMAQEVTITEQFNGYCFSVIQPFLDHLLKFKEATDDNNKMKDKIHSLELTINNLQSQLLKSETEIKSNVQQIKLKDEQIEDLREQIRGKDKQINVKDEQIKDKDKQINVKDEQIKDKDKQINDKVNQIHVKDEQIKDLREQIKGKDKQINVKDEQIKDLREDVKMISCLNSGQNGIFNIKVKGMEPFTSPCDSSGWTVIQRRINGSVDFNRSWANYKDGFGSIHRNFFLGLEKIHQLTLAQPHELYIQLRDVNGTTKYARYDDFKLGSENEAYKLKSLGEYSGTAGDSFIHHLDMKFTTLDRDNDLAETSNCATDHSGGWWFKKCATSTLNGIYYVDGKRTTSQRHGIHWGSWNNYDYTISLTFSQMMIRPKPL
ncbi:fibrinogen-like protein 1 [Drosophila obscura]|uniref:fibrinogen-like protein 1 n=1 Tax=Drosophila obscura TaxID=7282 RepID=UPI001BB2A63B|nr:fibrinogen-like protein 1 [Drosophila obscura]